MRLKAFAIAALLACSAAISIIPLAASAGMMDESMFVGTWYSDDGGESFYIEWRDDGTGTEWYEDSSGVRYSEYNFDWKLEDGKYKVSFDDGSSWHEYDYDFSATYDELTLTNAYGSETYSRKGMPDMGCCCCCGGFLLLPAGAFSTVATAVMAGRRHR